MENAGAQAREFAERFAGQASEDVESFKRAIVAGGSKLGEMLQDMQVGCVRFVANSA